VKAHQKILTRSKVIIRENGVGRIPPLPQRVRVLIKAVSVNIDIEYRDICCKNIEYRIEIEKAYRPTTTRHHRKCWTMHDAHHSE
jgi:hypothetical protein